MAGFYSRFLQTVERYPQQIAVEMQYSTNPAGKGGHPPLERHTYSDLHTMADSVGRWIQEQPLPGGVRGARVAILASNGPRWVAAYLGILAAGAVAVPLDTAFKAEQVAKLLQDCGAALLFTDLKAIEIAQSAISGTGVKLALLEPPGGAPGDKYLPHLDSMFAAGPVNFLPATATSDDLAVILYTSGTTSDPKGVMLTHHNIEAEAEAVFKFIDVGPSDGVLGVLPLFHALAQIANLLLPFIAGAHVVYLDSINTTELMRALRERDITLFCCVPQFFYLIHERVMKQVGEHGALEQFGFKLLMQFCRMLRPLGLNLGKMVFARVHASLGESLRYLITGGSRFDPGIGRDLEAMGFNILQAYGLTETSGGAFLTPPNQNAMGSVGQPLPGLEARIIYADEGATSRSVDEGETPAGEIVVRGGMVMKGYYNRPQATAEVLRDGWLYTGDLGYFDAQGNLFITGRKKDIIVLSSGKNIYPEEIEAHYLKSPFIKEICVLGLESKPGEPLSERLHAVVVPNLEVLRERNIVNTAEVIRYDIENLSVDLPSTKRILSYDIWQEDLPRTTTRKLKRFEIRNRVTQAAARRSAPDGAERSLSDEEARWLSDPLAQRAVEIIGAAAKKEGERIRPSDNLELDLGLDSMQRVELLVALESELEVHVDDSVASQVYTVKELVEALKMGTTGVPKTPAFSGWEAVLAVESDDPQVLAIAEPRPFSTLLWFLFGRLVNLFTRDKFSLRVTGLEKLPKRGPFILCPNHQSFLDAPVLVAQLPHSLYQDLFFVGTTEIFGSGLMLRLARSLKLIPIDPDSNLVPAMRAGAFGLRRGRVLLMYPEGERSITGEPKAFKKGAAILSLHLQVPIYPVALDGFFETWPRGQKFQGFHPLKIAIGDPILFPKVLNQPELQYQQITAELKSQIVAMRNQFRPGALKPRQRETAAAAD